MTGPEHPVCRRCGEPLVGSYSTHLVAAAEQLASIAPDGQGQGHAVLAATSACSWGCLAVLAAQLAGPDADAAVLMVAERERQRTAEGYHPEHDDQHHAGALAAAGVCYAIRHASGVPLGGPSDEPPDWWPWDAEWWKPKALRPDLVRAGALLAAELDRDRRLHPSPREQF